MWATPQLLTIKLWSSIFKQLSRQIQHFSETWNIFPWFSRRNCTKTHASIERNVCHISKLLVVDHCMDQSESAEQKMPPLNWWLPHYLHHQNPDYSIFLRLVTSIWLAELFNISADLSLRRGAGTFHRSYLASKLWNWRSARRARQIFQHVYPDFVTSLWPRTSSCSRRR